VTEQEPILSDGVIIEFVDGKDVPVQHKDFGERAVVMRDAKNPEGPILYFTEAEWDAFVLGVKDGEFDLDENGNLPPVPLDQQVAQQAGKQREQ
jgi:hypothetical protein